MEWLVSLYGVLEMIREYNIHLQIGLPIKQLALWQYIYFKGVLFYPFTDLWIFQYLYLNIFKGKEVFVLCQLTHWLGISFKQLNIQVEWLLIVKRTKSVQDRN